MPDIDGTNNSETLNGTAQNDFIRGFGGNDILRGLGGQDRLDGGAGMDIMTGGADRDLFILTYGEIQGDIITDLAPEDIIRLDVSALGAFSDSASYIDTIPFTGTPAEFRFSRGNGETLIEIDADGDAVADAFFKITNGEFFFNRVLIVGVLELVIDTAIRGTDQADNITGSAADEIFKGFGGDDIIDGGAGDDEINGNDGNDTLTGGTGEDTLYGGSGNDVLLGGTENDTLFGGDDNDVLRGGGGDDNLIGDAGDDNINGQAGDDTLQGREGNDSFAAEAGNDEYSGGSNDSIFAGGGDIISFANASAALDITFTGNTNTTTITTEFGTDELVGIEGIIGTSFDDIIRVPQFTDRTGVILDGRDGDDILQGGDGSDILLGGNGDDLLITGYGADEVDGGAGIDTVDFSGSFTAVNASLLTGDHSTDFERLELLDVPTGSNAPGSPSFGRTAIRLFSDALQDGQLNLLTFGSSSNVTDAQGVRTRTYDFGQLAFPAESNGGEAGFLRATVIEVRQADGSEAYSVIIDLFNIDPAIFDAIDFYATGLLTTDPPEGVIFDVLDNPETDITVQSQAGTLTNIEMIIGSDFDDSLEANSFDNTLTGGDGKDSFGFAAQQGDNVITDFAVQDDILNLDISPYMSFAQIKAMMTDGNDFTVLDMGNGTTTRFDGLQADDFTIANFRLTGIAEDGIGPFREGNDVTLSPKGGVNAEKNPASDPVSEILEDGFDAFDGDVGPSNVAANEGLVQVIPYIDIIDDADLWLPYSLIGDVYTA